jgi:nicotinate-nucleotide pyrophosphorylase (carboxylating)
MQNEIDNIIDCAFREDLGDVGDITSNLTIPEDRVINFQIANREDMILCGVDIALKVFDKAKQEKGLSIEKHFKDGDFLKRNSVIISGSGNARVIFAAERIALNLMQHLSGIATTTSAFVAQAKGKTQILDTRKTIPALRSLQKYAVKMGGAKNHRMALYDGILIKDNHIAAAGSIKNAVMGVTKELKNKIKIEVECDNLSQVKECLQVGVDIIMLDNMNLEQIKEAVELIKDAAKIEVSGNITLDRVAKISEAGVDYISIGALTHSVKALDIGLDVI